MTNKGLFYNLLRHIQENIWVYIISVLFLCTGIVLGIYAVKYMNTNDRGDLSAYFMNFVKTLGEKPINNKTIMIQTIKNNIPMIIIIFLLGFTMVGLPVILFIDMIKGFTIGFSFSFIISTMGAKGAILGLISIIPQNIFYVPCIVICSAIAMDMSLRKIKGHIDKHGFTQNNLVENKAYLAFFLFMICIAMLGVVVEGYITPSMIKHILT